MKEEQLKQLLESVLGISKAARGGDEAVFKCPSCDHHKKKLTLNLSNQKFQCWVCGYKGHRAFKLLKAIDATPAAYDALKEIDKQYNFKKSKRQKVDANTLQLPNGVQPLISSSAVLSRHANHYLTQRGITQQDIVKYNIHYSETGDLRNMVVIPSYDCNGFLNYYVGRSFDKNAYIKHKLASASKDIVGFEMLINWDIPVILCEGAFDAMTIKRNAIPLFGKKLSSNLMQKIIKSKCDSIYLALDDDALLDAFDHANKFISLGKKVYLIEMDGKDPNELGFEAFTQLLHKAEPITTADLMRKRLSLS
jgi:DNA primase|tara:strand:- start:709 stop:1632 length:924 start_codon:yes stop_codon:yes gene_type:complete